MEFNVKTVKLEKHRTACIVVAVFESKHLSPSAKLLDKASKGYITNILRKGDLTGKLGKTLLLHEIPNISSKRILLVGCGKEKEFGERQYKDVIKTIIKTLNDYNTTEALFCINECNVKERDLYWKIQQTILISEDILYTFDHYKSKKETNNTLNILSFNINKKDNDDAEQAIIESCAISKSKNYSKDIANTPPNICNPSYLAEEAIKLGKTYKKIKTTVINKKELEKLGMRAILAVGQGSVNSPKLITIEYSGNNNPKMQPIVLVGKGITFDSGGLSLKPSNSLVGMKFDMSGASVVLGMMLFAAKMKLPINIVGIIAAAENMPGGSAYRPNDIIKSLSGITIEILNTDAEGRLVLADAITYSKKFNPKAVIDVATLTGACIIALGKKYSGLISNNNQLSNELVNAGIKSSDDCWRLPLPEEYQESLNSKVADIKNSGNGEAGCITAACFLHRFAKDFNWAHLDVSGTAWDRTGNDASTGRPIPLLSQYLLNICKQIR